MKIILTNGTEALLRFKWINHTGLKDRAPRNCEAQLIVGDTRYVGHSECSKKDNPCRAKGRRVALADLLRYYSDVFGYGDRAEIWRTYFLTCSDLGRRVPPVVAQSEAARA